MLQWNTQSRIAELTADFHLTGLPDEIRRDVGVNFGSDYARGIKRRKRGKRGGVRLRLKKQQLTRLPLPSLILGNAQSLRNKLDELQGNVRFLRDYKDCCVMAFTESWLTEQDSDTDLSIDGFGVPFRQDRDAEVTGKSRGGGVCIYVNKRYCSSVTVRESLCSSDVELLSVSLRPFYLPREFPQIFITTVYIPPKANPSTATSTIFDVVQKLQSMSPEAPHFILGDFNHVSLKKSSKNFYQYVTCTTRKDKTLDLCYGTVKGAYKSLRLPPLGSADHNCVLLLPAYKTVLKSEKIQTKEVRIWSEESTSCLQGCFDCTDWDMFKDSCTDIDELTDVVCSYVTFCENMIIPTKTIKVYPNNKPWMSKEVRAHLQQKKFSFNSGGPAEQQVAKRELRTEILRAKQRYKAKVESKLAENNLSAAWSGIKTMAGIKQTKSTHITIDGFGSNCDLASALNKFYLRFDQFDFSEEGRSLRDSLKNDQHFALEQREVEKCLLSLKTNKSPGPDKISGILLKSCAKQLSPIVHHIFNVSLSQQKVPRLWKQAEIIPVPKVSRPKNLNDFRPIALTSLLMKVFEKLVKSELLGRTAHALDNMQFAYRAHRGVDDAILTLLNLLFKHLEGNKTHVKLTFIDFSSAFNTIQPHILATRLIEHFQLSQNLVGWILDFLTDRTQRVKVNGILSESLCSSTGSPQGCVLSPLLFILYTNMCRSVYENRHILKFADDTVIVSLLHNNESSHGPVLQDFISWCDLSFLVLNTSKTKDMTIDFRAQTPNCDPTVIKGQSVECVESYKYLGTVIDSKLSFNKNCEAVCKRGHQRLFYLRKLSSFYIDKTLLRLFYRAFIESVLSFALVSWFGNLSLQDKNSLNQIIKWAGRIIGEPQLTMAALYDTQLQRKASAIRNDCSHPLHGEFQLLRSGCRFVAPKGRTERYRSSFIPTAIVMLNSKATR